jgi:putative sterol carrier protein
MQSLLNRFIDNVQSANLSHFALLCLILMVIINIFIARKMSFIEQQLGELCQLIPTQKSTQFIKQPNTSEKRIYDTKEEKALWELLNRLDPDDASLKKVSRHTTEKLEGKEDVWDEDLYLSKSTKDRLDKHINELSNMIQEAGNNLKDVTKSIHLQRQKLNEE